MLSLLILLQAMSAEPRPDIELDIRARARSVQIEQKGEARLELRAEPDAGSRVEARVTPKAAGRTKLRNVDVAIHGEARIGDGVSVETQASAEAAETRSPD
jgi:hypothetical protein